MVKKKFDNKTITIGLLVVAGVFLFLVGNYTGQAWNWRPSGFGTVTQTTEGAYCGGRYVCGSGLECVNRKCVKVAPPAPPTPTMPPTTQPPTTTGLTGQQQKEVLDLIRNQVPGLIGSDVKTRETLFDSLNNCHVTSMDYVPNSPDENCDDLCDNHDEICIGGSFEEMGNIGGQRVTYYSGDLTSCSYKMYPPNFGGSLTYSCMCCKP